MSGDCDGEAEWVGMGETALLLIRAAPGAGLRAMGEWAEEA